MWIDIQISFHMQRDWLYTTDPIYHTEESHVSNFEHVSLLCSFAPETNSLGSNNFFQLSHLSKLFQTKIYAINWAMPGVWLKRDARMCRKVYTAVVTCRNTRSEIIVISMYHMDGE